jgi:RNA polymerase sigma-70 factor (ECF subfamily)
MDFVPAQSAMESSVDPLEIPVDPGPTAGNPALAGAGAMAFETLLRRHQAMVFGIARHYLCDDGRAEDIAQDVFLQLHRELPRLQSEAHVVSWLRRVTVHRAIDALRSPAFHRATALDALGELPAPAKEQDVLLQDWLRRLVASLPEQQRMAVVLRYQEDLDPGEIADLLEMPVATVKSHLRRALEGLRAKAGRLVTPLAAREGNRHE